MKPSVFAATVAASLLTLTFSRPTQAQFIAPYGTGYMGAGGLQYNSMQGATMSVMLQGMQQQAMMNSMMYSSMARYGGSRRRRPSASQLQTARGRRLIKRGRATTRFALRPINSVQLVNDWAKTNANGRAGALAEWREQSTIWRQAASQRNARLNDLAQADALAFVLCLEAYTGRQQSNAGYRSLVTAFRRYYLTDAYAQGKTLAQKQSDYEATMLSATWAMYLRRHGKIEEARKTAAKWLDENWTRDKDSKYASDVESAVASYAKFQTGPLAMPSARVASAPITRAKPLPRVASRAGTEADNAPPVAPQMSLEQANKFVQYKPVAPSVLPAMLIANEPADKRRESRELYENMIRAGRESFRKLFVPSDGSKEDVADATTFALMTFYTAYKTDSGRIGDAGFTAENLQAVSRQITFVLANNPKFRAQSVKDKQALLEGALMMAVTIGYVNEQAKQSDDAQLRAKAKQAASDAFRTFLGKTPDQVRLTNAGWQF